MKTIFETCQPREEVLSSDLREEEFAASLTRVLRGEAKAVYGDPAIYFPNTFPTGGFKSLLGETMGRLSGAKLSNAPVIRLETSFGGGKTHNLIGLYHLCKSKLDPKALQEFLPPKLLPGKPIKHIAGVVGPDLEPDNGIDHGDVRTFTMWGEIAYQLGGKAGYNIVSKSDQQRTSPGTQVWQKLIGDAPALIMIDEMAWYLRVTRGIQSGSGKTTLAEQAVAFLMSLMKFAAESKQTVLVYTLTESSDAFGKEADQLREELREARSISSRQEHVLTPTAENEISAIVTHRLFANVNQDAARETAQAFSDYYRQKIDQEVDLPARAVRAEYANEIVEDYPFHPELLTTLNRKTSTIPNFQKTRGALRLLATTIRELWRTKPKDCYLICPCHFNLGNDDVASELTSRLDRPQFKQVIEADIASPRQGTLSHAQEIDRDWVETGKPPFAQRVATTAFLHSIVQTGRSGVDPADLRVAVLQPGDDPALIDKAMQQLVDQCWFFDYDGYRYRFKTEPSLRKIVDDEMGLVGKIQAKSELDERIKKVWKRGALAPKFFPAEPSEVDDDAQAPKLVVVHYDAACVKTGAHEPPPDLVLRIFEHKGSMEEYRTFKNNVLFLVPDEDQMDRMVEVSQRYLAVQRIVGDPDRIGEFNKEQARKLKKMAEAAELDVRVAVTRAYRHLYYPSADAPRKNGNLAHHLLQPGEQGEVDRDQTEVVLRMLKNLDKVLTADQDKPLSAQYLKAKAWPTNADSMTTEQLRQAFAQRLSLKMLLDINQLKRTIRDGAGRGVWVYYPTEEGLGYGPPSPAPMVEISQDVYLYTPEEAQRKGIKIKGAEPKPEVCPVCNQHPCVCDIPPPPTPTALSAEGSPSQAFQAIADQCHDQNVVALRKLHIAVEGMGKDAAHDVRSLGLAIPQMGKAAFSLQQKLVLEFDAGEKFAVDFTGSWDRYKRIKSLTDALSQEASNASVHVTVQADFEAGLEVAGDQFQTIRDVLASLEMGKIRVDAEPAAEEEK